MNRPISPWASRPPSTPTRNHDQRHRAAAAHEVGPEEVVDQHDEQAPDREQHRGRQWSTHEGPDHCRQHHQRRADLDDAQHEHQERQQRRRRDAGRREADPRQDRLHERGSQQAARDVRIVCPIRSARSGPRSPTRRKAIASAARTPASSLASRMPATTTDARNLSTLNVAPANRASSQPATARSSGAICPRAPPILVEVSCHKLAIGWPMSGRSVSVGGGGGIVIPPLSRSTSNEAVRPATRPACRAARSTR